MPECTPLDSRGHARSKRVRWRRVLGYYAIVYALSYGLVAGFLVTGGSFDDPSWVFFAQISSLTPALVALAMARLLWREPLGDSLGLRLGRRRWLLLAWILPWLLALFALGLGLLVPGAKYDGSLQPAVDRAIVSHAQLEMLRGWATRLSLSPIVLLVPLGVVTSVTMSFVAGCGEELGWRGLVHTELRPLGFWRNVAVTWALWLGWHLPLVGLGYGYPDHPVAGLGVMAVHLLVGSVGYAYVRERAASSVAVGLMHGTTESTALLAVAPVAGGTDLTVGLGGACSIGATAIVVLGLFAYDRFIAARPILGRAARAM